MPVGQLPKSPSLLVIPVVFTFVDLGPRMISVTQHDAIAGPYHRNDRAIADVMNRRMETDDSIVVMGEDVHRLKGGTNGATRGLKERFAERTLGTPISENAFCGLGGGLALDGRFKPVVEFMYPR